MPSYDFRVTPESSVTSGHILEEGCLVELVAQRRDVDRPARRHHASDPGRRSDIGTVLVQLDVGESTCTY